MPAKRPQVARLHKRVQRIRVNIGIIVLDVFIEDLTEQVVDLGGIEAGAVHVVTARLQALQQISQRHGLPFAGCFVEHDVQRFFVRFVFNMNDHALKLGRALCGQHLVPLVATHDIARGLVPNNRVNVPEVRQAALDLLIRWITRLQVFARIIFGRLHLRYGNGADVHAGLYFRHKNLLPEIVTSSPFTGLFLFLARLCFFHIERHFFTPADPGKKA